MEKTIKHDIITTRTGFWICKCGEAGRTNKTLEDHKRLIELEQSMNMECEEFLNT